LSICVFLLGKEYEQKLTLDTRVPMKKAASRKAAQNARKQPTQRRSAETVAVIVEAAARVLEERGLGGFNTNAVAERAGVSIGSLYQYFRNKNALLEALFERQAEPFLRALEAIPKSHPFQVALRDLIEASVEQQLNRPELARILDFVEAQAAFHDLAKRKTDRALKVLVNLLRLPGAPNVRRTERAALEMMNLIRAMTDFAGELRERDRDGLVQRICGAVTGYLESSSA
jgi:AcrR family transcriptional regulator